MQNIIEEIIGERQLFAVFQPIISMKTGLVLGYEGLIRAHATSPWQSPAELFSQAQACGMRLLFEQVCREVVLDAYRTLNLNSKLFLNITHDGLFQFLREQESTDFAGIGLRPDEIVLELTEDQPVQDYARLREALNHFRQRGFEFAVDDLGEGYATLRLWSELRPHYVKIDKHFIQSIHRDPIKLQFVRSIQQIADNAHARVIAEGIETQAELLILKNLGIPYGQGFHLARPSVAPANTLSAEVIFTIHQREATLLPGSVATPPQSPTARKLLLAVTPVGPETPNESVYRLFTRNPELQSIPVVSDDLPIGLISRHKLIDFFARLYTRDLYGKKPCSELMDREPLVVDINIRIQELSHLLVAGDRRHLSDGFILTERDRYVGVGTGHDLVREITVMQIHAARYANPLTLLPGNVPIQEHIDQLLQRQCHFVACHCDLDSFKPFNDRYGYGRGDEVIQLTGKVLSSVCDPELDFIGHVGGDDFVLVMQSPDWEARCRLALDQFHLRVQAFFAPADLERQGYSMEDRRGEVVFHPLTHLSIGASPIAPGSARSHLEVSAWMSESKKQAKRERDGFFIDRRTHRRAFQGEPAQRSQIAGVGE